VTVAPIVHSTTVKAAPDRAFEIFTKHMGRWWGVGRTLGQAPHRDMVVEPHEGGKWYEIDANGKEIRWGTVAAWEPGSRLLLNWQVNSKFTFDPDFSTDVEITFTAAPHGGTVVRLEHRNLERFGADTEKFAGMLEGGWLGHLEAVKTYIANQA
jgi:uncharacterized protein YndB with AHSA1/START domain